MQKISILGCGWLGLPLGAALVAQGYEVKGSTTSTDKLKAIHEAGIQPYLLKAEGEQLIGINVKAFFESEILFLNIPPNSRKDPEVEQNYPRKVQLILQQVLLGNVKKLLFVSSTGVYGNNNDLVDEETPPAPERPSGNAILTTERLLKLHEGLDITILRMAGLVGGERKAGRFLAGKKDVANGSAPVNLVHLDDCIEVILQIIGQQQWNTTFNVCADEHPTRAAFYVKQAKQQGLEPPTFKPEGKKDKFKVISNRKLKDQLAYKFKYPDPMEF